MIRMFPALSLMMLISSCSQRLYRHRTINVFATHQGASKSDQSNKQPLRAVKQKVDVPQLLVMSSDLFGFDATSNGTLKMDVKQAFKSVFVSESDRIKTKLSEKKEKFKRLTSPI